MKVKYTQVMYIGSTRKMPTMHTNTQVSRTDDVAYKMSETSTHEHHRFGVKYLYV